MKNLIVRSLPLLRGGPDFDDSEKYTIDLGGQSVEFFMPRNHLTLRVSVPLHQELDLEAPPESLISTQYDYRTEHRVINLKGATWTYKGPWWRCGNEPYVIVSTTWRVECVKNDASLVQSDLGQLQDYLEQDYLNYFEGEGGPNHRVRREAYEFFSSRPRPIEEYAEDIKNRIEARARKLPNDYEQATFGEMKWLRFTWAPSYRELPQVLIYCRTLDPHHILTVTFDLTEMVSGYRETWMPKVWEDTEKVMTGTKVHYRELPGKTGSPD